MIKAEAIKKHYEALFQSKSRGKQRELPNGIILLFKQYFKMYMRGVHEMV